MKWLTAMGEALWLLDQARTPEEMDAATAFARDVLGSEPDRSI